MGDPVGAARHVREPLAPRRHVADRRAVRRRPRRGQPEPGRPRLLRRLDADLHARRRWPRRSGWRSAPRPGEARLREVVTRPASRASAARRRPRSTSSSRRGRDRATGARRRAAPRRSGHRLGCERRVHEPGADLRRERGEGQSLPVSDQRPGRHGADHRGQRLAERDQPPAPGGRRHPAPGAQRQDLDRGVRRAGAARASRWRSRPTTSAREARRSRWPSPARRATPRPASRAA